MLFSNERFSESLYILRAIHCTVAYPVSATLFMTSKEQKLCFSVLSRLYKWVRLDSYNHRFDIEECSVTEYFNGDKHAPVDMTVVTIDQIHSHDPCPHKIREKRWIRTLQLGTSYPLGMNFKVG